MRGPQSISLSKSFRLRGHPWMRIINETGARDTNRTNSGGFNQTGIMSQVLIKFGKLVKQFNKAKNALPFTRRYSRVPNRV